MKWLKHYTNAHCSELLENVIQKYGFEGYGRYWRLLEYLGALFDGQTATYRIHNRTLRDILRFKTTVKLREYLLYIGYSPSIRVVELDNHFQIEAPILLKLKDRQYKNFKAISNEFLLEEKRIDKNRIEENRKDQNKKPPPPSGNLISFDSVSQLYTELCVGKGKIKPGDFFASGPTIDNLRTLSGFPQFQTEKQWREYFTRVAESKFLIGEAKDFVVTLTWLLKPENAEKVLQGQYDNNEKKAKTRRQELLDSMTPEERAEVEACER